MTIKTLTYIHALLVKAEHETGLALEYNNDDYYEIAENYRDGLVFKAAYEEAKAVHEKFVADHDQALAALREFEEKEW